MPLYVYRCEECENVFEVTQRITEEPIKCCFECNGAVRRLIQPIGIIFNGPGFYVNDYKKKQQEIVKES